MEWDITDHNIHKTRPHKIQIPTLNAEDANHLTDKSFWEHFGSFVVFFGYLGNFRSRCWHGDILQHVGPCFGCNLVMPVNHEMRCIIYKTQQKTILGEPLTEAQQSSVSHTSCSFSQVIVFHVRSQSVTQTSHNINKVKNVKEKRFELCWCTCGLSFVSFFLSRSPLLLYENMKHVSVFHIFTSLSRLTVMSVKWRKWSWTEVNRKKGHTHLAEPSVCMIGAEWMKHLLMLCSVTTLEYTVCSSLAHTYRHTDWLEKMYSFKWNLMICIKFHSPLLFLLCNSFSRFLYYYCSICSPEQAWICVCSGPVTCGQPSHRHHQHGHFCVCGSLLWSPWRYVNTFKI